MHDDGRFCAKEVSRRKRGTAGERNYEVHQFLLEAHVIQQKSLLRQHDRWIQSIQVWQLEKVEWMGRGVVVAETRGAALHLLLRARELRDRAGINNTGTGGTVFFKVSNAGAAI